MSIHRDINLGADEIINELEIFLEKILENWIFFINVVSYVQK
jgi:hypothetical protein